LEEESSLGLASSRSRVRLAESGSTPGSLDFGGSAAAAVESGELGERGSLAERHLWALGVFKSNAVPRSAASRGSVSWRTLARVSNALKGT